jgi:hypothetical protein
MFNKRRSQLLGGWIGAIAIAALFSPAAPASAFDDSKYPDLSGQWLRVNLQSGGQPSFDPTKAWGLGQQAPYTPEYKAILEASIADQANGGQGNWSSGERCLPPGMPGTMNGYNSMELVVLPEITYVLIEHNLPIHRRIYTDGRDWPKEAERTFQGYSIGRWIDSGGAGRFDLLEIETRYFKGPRSMDAAGLPLAADNQSIIKERFHLDKADPNRLYDDITLVDHALTRPWTASKLFRRSPAQYPSWVEQNCPSTTRLLKIGDELYFKGADDNLLPTRKDQPPPDLRYFGQKRP